MRIRGGGPPRLSTPGSSIPVGPRHQSIDIVNYFISKGATFHPRVSVTMPDLQKKAPPEINLPKSDSTCKVQAINTTTDLLVAAEGFVKPILKGHERLNLPTLCFLLDMRSRGRRSCLTADRGRTFGTSLPRSRCS